MTSPDAHPAPTLPVPPEGSRRAQIALVAAEEFTRRGYHSTRVEHIAERLSVTPGALYRHVPGKYEMFRDAVAATVDALETATSAAGTAGPGAPDALDQVVGSLTRTTLAHRSRAALYPWQARYLAPGDRADVAAAIARVRHRVAEAVGKRRRGGPGPGAGTVAGAVLSCIASLGHHRIGISDADAVTLMTSIAGDLAASTPPGHASFPPGTASAPPGHAAVPPGHASFPPGTASALPQGGVAAPPARLRGGAATREAAITAAIGRFHSSGYDGVTMETIGADVGVAASALYRHFPGKTALLTAAVDRTAALVEELLDRHAALRSPGVDPARALADLLEQYVAIAFSHGPALMLYHSELGALDRDDRDRVRRAQRAQLDRWAGLVLEAARGGLGLDEAAARIRVHAALAVVLDGGRTTGFHPAATAWFGDLAGIPLLLR